MFKYEHTKSGHAWIVSINPITYEPVDAYGFRSESAAWQGSEETLVMNLRSVKLNLKHTAPDA